MGNTVLHPVSCPPLGSMLLSLAGHKVFSGQLTVGVVKSNSRVCVCVAWVGEFRHICDSLNGEACPGVCVLCDALKGRVWLDPDLVHCSPLQFCPTYHPRIRIISPDTELEISVNNGALPFRFDLPRADFPYHAPSLVKRCHRGTVVLV